MRLTRAPPPRSPAAAPIAQEAPCKHPFLIRAAVPRPVAAGSQRLRTQSVSMPCHSPFDIQSRIPTFSDKTRRQNEHAMLRVLPLRMRRAFPALQNLMNAVGTPGFRAFAFPEATCPQSTYCYLENKVFSFFLPLLTGRRCRLQVSGLRESMSGDTE